MSSGARTRWFSTLLGLVALQIGFAGCSTFGGVRPEAPKVSVVSVRPLNLSLSRQQLLFRLHVANPNPFPVELQSLDFTASFAGEEIAEGLSNDEVTLPARGEALMDVEVDAGFDRVLERFRRMIERRELALDYAVEGHVKLANWPRRIPFDVDGELENPLESGE